MPGTDQELRNALIRTNLALLQREIREKKNWYTTRRVVVRKRNGRIHLSRLGSRPQNQLEDEGGFTFIDEPLSPRSARTNSSASSFGSVDA
ncbi:hypothetical protein AAE478_009050 [Parahypoxylon ruwenzoriense]